jgi:activating signal cointegrator complex subunit 3
MLLLFVQGRDTKAYTQRFPKPKDEGWVLVVGDAEAKEVVALKRVSNIRGVRTSAQLALVSPENTGRVIYTVYLMSDSYLGLDQQYDVCLDVLPASLETQVNSELAGQEDDIIIDMEVSKEKKWADY